MQRRGTGRAQRLMEERDFCSDTGIYVIPLVTSQAARIVNCGREGFRSWRRKRGFKVEREKKQDDGGEGGEVKD